MWCLLMNRLLYLSCIAELKLLGWIISILLISISVPLVLFSFLFSLNYISVHVIHHIPFFHPF